MDNEIKGVGNSINYKFRMHDPRIGRFFAVDPLSAKYPYNSPYAFSENQVINAVELEGLEKHNVISPGAAFGKMWDNFVSGFNKSKDDQTKKGPYTPSKQSTSDPSSSDSEPKEFVPQPETERLDALQIQQQDFTLQTPISYSATDGNQSGSSSEGNEVWSNYKYSLLGFGMDPVLKETGAKLSLSNYKSVANIGYGLKYTGKFGGAFLSGYAIKSDFTRYSYGELSKFRFTYNTIGNTLSYFGLPGQTASLGMASFQLYNDLVIEGILFESILETERRIESNPRGFLMWQSSGTFKYMYNK
jgi:hypothetical protein